MCMIWTCILNSVSVIIYCIQEYPWRTKVNRRLMARTSLIKSYRFEKICQLPWQRRLQGGASCWVKKQQSPFSPFPISCHARHVDDWEGVIKQSETTSSVFTWTEYELLLKEVRHESCSWGCSLQNNLQLKTIRGRSLCPALKSLCPWIIFLSFFKFSSWILQ